MYSYPLSWYINFIKKPLLVVTILLLVLEALVHFPQFNQFTLTLATPFAWLIKIGGAFYVGYKIALREKKLFQSVLGGLILGIGIGMVSIGIAIFRRITYVKPELFGVFGGLDIFFTTAGEMITAAFFSAVGSVLAGGKLNEEI